MDSSSRTDNVVTLNVVTPSLGTNSLVLGTSFDVLPPVWPKFVLEDIEANKGWKFKWDPEDPLFKPEDKYERYKVRPIKYTRNYQLYKQGEASHWTAEEATDFSQDIIDWRSPKMLGGPQTYISKVLVYFLSADSGVGENALLKFSRMFPQWQINQFYLWQAFNESIHSETYAMAVETFVEDLDSAFNGSFFVLYTK